MYRSRGGASRAFAAVSRTGTVVGPSGTARARCRDTRFGCLRFPQSFRGAARVPLVLPAGVPFACGARLWSLRLGDPFGAREGGAARVGRARDGVAVCGCVLVG